MRDHPLKLQLKLDRAFVADLVGDKILRNEIEREVLVPGSWHCLTHCQSFVPVTHQPDLPCAVIGVIEGDRRNANVLIVNIDLSARWV